MSDKNSDPANVSIAFFPLFAEGEGAEGEAGLLSREIPNYAFLVLRRLTRLDARFVWLMTSENAEQSLMSHQQVPPEHAVTIVGTMGCSAGWLGSLSAGPPWRIEAALRSPAEDGPRGEFSYVFPGDELPAVTAAIVSDLLDTLGIEPREPVRTFLAREGTDCADALICFLQALDHHPELGVTHTGSTEYHRWLLSAVSADPGFRLAFDELIRATGDIGRDQLDPRAPRVLESILERDPACSRAHFALGEYRLVCEETERAREHFEEGLRLDPEFTFGHLRLGTLRLASQEPEKAVEAYRQAIRCDAACVPALVELGALLAQQNKLEEAAPHLTEAIRIAPQLGQAYAYLGAVRARQGKPEEAERLFQRGLAQDKACWPLSLNYAMFMMERGRDAEATAVLEEATAREQPHPMAQAMLGMLYGRSGRIEESVRSLHQAIELDPEGAAGQIARMRLEQLEEEARPAVPEAQRLERCAALLREGRDWRAAWLLGWMVLRKREHWQAWFLLGTALAHRGRVRAAIGAFRRVVALVEEHAAAHAALANLYLRRRKPMTALDHARTACASEPRPAGAVRDLGVALLRLGQLEEAEERLREARALAPSDPMISICLDQLGRLRAKEASG